MANTPAPVTSEFQNKLNAGLRYTGTSAFTLFTILGVLSLITPEQLAELKTQIDVLGQSILTGYGALTKMWIILGPVGAGLMLKLGIQSSTVQALAQKLLGIAKNDQDPKATDAKVAIVSVAADPTVVGPRGGVVASAEIAANPATPANVVASPAQLPRA
jgi:hypothetical protein